MNARFPLPDLDWPPLAEFWASAARGELSLPRCVSCGSWRWYPDGPCTGCVGETALHWDRLSGRGVLYSWTIVRRAFIAEMADAIPYVSALVTLEEDPRLRIATRIVDCDPGELKGNLPVSVVFRPLQFAGVEGSVLAPLFAPR